MEISNKEFELLKIILEDSISYFEDKSGNDFYLQGEDTSERLKFLKKLLKLRRMKKTKKNF